MDLQTQWNELKSNLLASTTIDNSVIISAIKKESKDAISILKNRLIKKLYWAIFFLVCFSFVLAGNYENIDLALIISSFIVYYLINVAYLIFQIRNLSSGIDLGMEPLNVLKVYLKTFKDTFAAVNTFFLLFVPVSIPAGLLLLDIYNGIEIIAIISSSTFLIKTAILVVILTPLAIYINKKMNQIAFGEYLEKLEQNVVKLELVG